MMCRRRIQQVIGHPHPYGRLGCPDE